MRRLSGKVAIITGAARGLGAATAARLASEGAVVMLVDVLSEGEETAAALQRQGHRALYKHLDVTDEPGWLSLVEQSQLELGGVDILVNNAGISRPGDVESIGVSALREVMAVNVIGPFLGIKAVIPAMRKRGGGSIINVASSLTQKAMASSCAYGASKGALSNLTKTAAIHCAEKKYNIRINSIHPGPHETAMLLGSATSSAESPMATAISQMIPLRRLGAPADVAAAVAYLASDDAAFVTATELFIDGGLSVV